MSEQEKLNKKIIRLEKRLKKLKKQQKSDYIKKPRKLTEWQILVRDMQLNYKGKMKPKDIMKLASKQYNSKQIEIDID